MVFKLIQSSFVGGELSPTIIGRTDQDIYAKGAKQLKNVYVNAQGYLTRREGLEYIDNTPSDSLVRLIPFTFSTEQDYILEFSEQGGTGQFRVFKDDVLQVTVTSAPVDALTADQIQEFKFTQSADTLLIFHPDFETIRITRTSDVAWTTAFVGYTNIPPFPFSGVTVTEPAADITPSATQGRDITITASAGVFDAGDVGQFINIKTGGLIFITAFVSATEVEGNVQSNLASTDPVVSGDWELEEGYEDVWSNSRGWPSTGTFFQGRLWVANSSSRPQTLWGSQVGDFFNFDIGQALDADAIDVTIDDDQVNAILDVFAGRNLQIFTTGGEFFVPADVGKPITPQTVAIPRTTNHGSNNMRPVSLDGATLFIEKGGNVLREFLFSDVEQGYTAANISIISSHLLDNPTRSSVRKATSLTPTDFIYFVNDNGNVAVLNTLRDQSLLAWTEFTTDGTFLDVATIGEDVYFVVEREIDSSTVRHIEKLNPNHFTDASTLQTSGVPTTAWSGLDHLEGETVKVRGDDFILDDEVVVSGAITSSLDVLELEAGLNFSVLIETLPIITFGDVRFVGELRRLVWANFRLNDSRDMIVQVGNNTYKPAFRQFGSELLDQPVQLFTGWKKVYLNGGDRDISLTITQEEPLEFNLLAITIGIQ